MHGRTYPFIQPRPRLPAESKKTVVSIKLGVRVFHEMKRQQKDGPKNNLVVTVPKYNSGTKEPKSKYMNLNDLWTERKASFLHWASKTWLHRPFTTKECFLESKDLFWRELQKGLREQLSWWSASLACTRPCVQFPVRQTNQPTKRIQGWKLQKS